MAEAVLMPKVGISVESCIITAWRKQIGDKVNIGDILFEYETDKSSLECESTAEGILLEQFFEDGDEVEVLLPVCAIGAQGEDVSALRAGGTTEESKAQEAQSPAAGQAPQSGAAAVQSTAGAGMPAAGVPADGSPLKISPRAKTLAQKQSVNPALATPTGPNGRVIERDIRAAFENGTDIGGRMLNAESVATSASSLTSNLTAAKNTDVEYTDIKFSGIRKLISAGMSQSLATIPQLTHNFSFDASNILSYRALLKQNAEKMGLPSITLNDFILFAVSRLLPKYPELNAHMLDGTTMRQFTDVNLGMAVDTPRGLMVPKIMQANKKSLAQIATEAKLLAKQAQEGSISPDLLSNGTFTVSNLGVFGVESFTPVINPPETGILGVDNIIKRVREGKNGEIEMYPAMGISLTYDHRAIDGAPASRFAKELCEALESFTLLLAGE